MRDAAVAVIQFNKEVLGIEPRPLSPMPVNEYDHLLKGVQEELFVELAQAWSEQDIIDMVDAKIDAIYWLIGGLYKMGLSAQQIEGCFMAVHMANMKKMQGRVERRAVEGAFDAIKPEGWIDPKEEIAKILGLVAENEA